MKTYIFMVRHGYSPKEGDERTRELTNKGIIDAFRVADVLKEEEINAVISSPYKRSVQTAQGLADQLGQKVLIMEELKEISTANKLNEQVNEHSGHLAALSQVFVMLFSNPGMVFNIALTATQMISSRAIVPRELLSEYRESIACDLWCEQLSEFNLWRR
ncbi:phosphoglycerate mutase family protein [Oceanobacillus neutriphilus]|uniref:Histidine phosphatase family protein n=1 Tax=Oceanobacillus neutriphilus TaxID=531815 RepID=A0ABQ2P2A6_9BACI|nr:phosphoglycerate mutase family protein [Oceanobacillus neutriphilus]GGP16382.1 hypothetical protein GCM10011346_48210 [Oceanobacillus neutriphilus]